MRRSRVAVSGIVCALFVGSGMFVGCRSREDEARQLASVSQEKQAAKKEQQVSQLLVPEPAHGAPPAPAGKMDPNPAAAPKVAMKAAPAPMMKTASKDLSALMGAKAGGIGGLG